VTVPGPAVAALDLQLDHVLRAVIGDTARSAEAAGQFVDAFDVNAALDPRVYAALPALHARVDHGARTDDTRWNLIRGTARRVWAHNQIRLAAAQSALGALARVGADPIVLPGAITSMAALDDTGVRVLERVIVLVEPDHLPRVTAALLADGASIRQDTATLLDHRQDWQHRLDADLAEGTLTVQTDHRGIDASSLDALRGRTQPLRLGPLVASAPAPSDGLVMTLAALTDGDPDPIEWTNLVLELARLMRLVGDDDAERAASVAHHAGRYDVWTGFVRLIADLSKDGRDEAVAERFAATPRPVAPESGAATPPRSAGARAGRMLRDYRADATRRCEPVTVRGLARYLTQRWRLHDLRSLPIEIARRVARARPAQPAAPPSNSANNASRTGKE
jgi:hypothetical protein